MVWNLLRVKWSPLFGQQPKIANGMRLWEAPMPARRNKYKAEFKAKVALEAVKVGECQDS